jgi:hypothetical protein
VTSTFTWAVLVPRSVALGDFMYGIEFVVVSG